MYKHLYQLNQNIYLQPYHMLQVCVWELNTMQSDSYKSQCKQFIHNGSILARSKTNICKYVWSVFVFFVCVYVFYVSLYVHVCVCMCVCVCVCMYLCVCTCVFVCMFVFVLCVCV